MEMDCDQQSKRKPMETDKFLIDSSKNCIEEATESPNTATSGDRYVRRHCSFASTSPSSTESTAKNSDNSEKEENEVTTNDSFTFSSFWHNFFNVDGTKCNSSPTSSASMAPIICYLPPQHFIFLLAQFLAAIALLGITAALLLPLQSPLFTHLVNHLDFYQLDQHEQQQSVDASANLLAIDSALMEERMETECARTCKIELVESVAQNISFSDSNNISIVRSTFSVWMQLINEAQHSLALAAYKTSLRGKHVLGDQQLAMATAANSNLSLQGEMVFDALLEAGLERGIPIRMVENAVAKDKGDNEDGNSLYRRGALFRRILNLQRLYHTGIMHSKFVLADGKHFYLGSANFDWRSLTQKMELGVFGRDCPCLGQDMAKIFDVYWRAATMKTATEVHKMIKQSPPAKYNAKRPLRLLDADNNWLAVHLATSPKSMNCPERSWDLDDILAVIRASRRHIDIHVMDYFPMFLYTQNRKYWPEIDNTLRGAILRGVNVRIIAAALHFPDTGLHFLKSLQTLCEIPGAGSVEVKIFKVPTPKEVKQSVLRRDRRTHKKFLLTDDALIIGTSNWSGDYFESHGTGVAIVIRREKQPESSDSARVPPLFRQMRAMFERDWQSGYAHQLDWYMQRCLEPETDKTQQDQEVCEAEKDPTLLAASATA